MIRDSIHAAIKEELISLGAPDVPFVVERPADFSHGGYATNAALTAAKVLKRNPREIAEILSKKLASRSPSASGVGVHVQQISLPDVAKIEVAGAGFINFFISHQALLREITAAQDDLWGRNDAYANKVVMVEYTDPNPFKEFHIGHLMSNAIGESIARLLEWSGAEVIRANYQGDVGPHVAKALFVLLEQQIESPTIAQISLAYVEGAKRYEENSVDKAAIDVLNKKIYDQSDDKVNALYKKGRELSLKHFEELYSILDTTFDVYFFESESGPEGLEIVKAHPGIFERSDGAIIFRGEQYGLHTRVFVNSQGLPTYEAKDLGLIELKQEKSAFDESITITASEQNDYFKVVLKAAELVYPDLRGLLTHVSHGMMRFAEGKMSSRKGNVITGESLLADLTDEAKIKMRGRELADADAIAQQVAVAAVKYVVLKQGSGKDIIFDPERSLSLEGDSGPYLQYARVRAASLLRKAKEAKQVFEMKVETDSDWTEVSGFYRLIRILVHFPEVLEHSAKELEPHYVTTYLTELSSEFNSWYASERIITNGEVMPDRLNLVAAVEQTLKKGLHVLGIPAPEEM